MAMRRLLLLVAVAWVTSMASAVSAEPDAAPPARNAPAPQAAPVSPGRNCVSEIAPLLAEAEEKGKAIKPAAATKQHSVVCQAFRNLAAAEGKVIKYFDDYGAECGIPADAMRSRKGNFQKITDIRAKVCEVNGPPSFRMPPPYPKSDELRCTPQLKGSWGVQGAIAPAGRRDKPARVQHCGGPWLRDTLPKRNFLVTRRPPNMVRIAFCRRVAYFAGLITEPPGRPRGREKTS
jgi:hypothetical protein